MKIFRILFSLLLTGAILIFGIKPALAFCGFYVAKADSSLYNQASQVIIARDGRRTVLTMSNDYQGEVKDFAMIVPVPYVLAEKDIQISDSKIIEKLDAYSSPRLVEYFDNNPCPRYYYQDRGSRAFDSVGKVNVPLEKSGIYNPGETLGVTIEKEFSIGEYDISILSAKESDGLQTWLTQKGYKLPQNISKLLQPYIRQGMKFFVVKINLSEHNSNDYKRLRPLSISYNSFQFMLPIRLGMTNAQDKQDLIVYLLSPKGQVELANYRSVKIPSDREIPEFVKAEFPDFYQAMFQKSHRKEPSVAFLEYAWDLSIKCDPCVSGALTPEELKQAGVYWSSGKQNNINVFLTRLHLRYSRNAFPEDLNFRQTSNTQNFQGRYIIRHPFRSDMTCEDAKKYQEFARYSQESEVNNLADITGWDIPNIRSKVDFIDAEPVLDFNWLLEKYRKQKKLYRWR